MRTTVQLSVFLLLLCTFASAHDERERDLERTVAAECVNALHEQAENRMALMRSKVRWNSTEEAYDAIRPLVPALNDLDRETRQTTYNELYELLQKSTGFVRTRHILPVVSGFHLKELHSLRDARSRQVILAVYEGPRSRLQGFWFNENFTPLDIPPIGVQEPVLDLDLQPVNPCITLRMANHHIRLRCFAEEYALLSEPLFRRDDVGPKHFKVIWSPDRKTAILSGRWIVKKTSEGQYQATHIDVPEDVRPDMVVTTPDGYFYQSQDRSAFKSIFAGRWGEALPRAIPIISDERFFSYTLEPIGGLDRFWISSHSKLADHILRYNGTAYETQDLVYPEKFKFASRQFAPPEFGLDFFGIVLVGKRGKARIVQYYDREGRRLRSPQPPEGVVIKSVEYLERGEAVLEIFSSLDRNDSELAWRVLGRDLKVRIPISRARSLARFRRDTGSIHLNHESFPGLVWGPVHCSSQTVVRWMNDNTAQSYTAPQVPHGDDIYDAVWPDHSLFIRKGHLRPIVAGVPTAMVGCNERSFRPKLISDDGSFFVTQGQSRNGAVVLKKFTRAFPANESR